MVWNKTTIGLALGTALLTIALYAIPRKVPKIKKGQEADTSVAVDENLLINEAKKALDSTQRVWIADLEQRKSAATDLNQELSILKLLSRSWRENKNLTVSAIYAEQVAQLQPSGEAWSIAGTTYGSAFFNSQDQAVKRFVAQKAISAFEKAKLAEPDTLRHWLNEATMWIELSSVDAKVPPMKGVGLLRELEAKFPNSPQLHLTLGRLSATRSGDLDKALPRFIKVVELAKTEVVPREMLLEAHYFLADIYTQKQQKDSAIIHYDACLALTQDEPEVQEKLKAAKESLKN
jgi:tetratricopeptide (TPR) repeat protein